MRRGEALVWKERHSLLVKKLRRHEKQNLNFSEQEKTSKINAYLVQDGSSGVVLDSSDGYSLIAAFFLFQSSFAFSTHGSKPIGFSWSIHHRDTLPACLPESGYT